MTEEETHLLDLYYYYLYKPDPKTAQYYWSKLITLLIKDKHK